MITFDWKKDPNYERGKCCICKIHYEKLAVTCDEKGICNTCEQAMYKLAGESFGDWHNCEDLLKFRDEHREEIKKIADKIRKH